MYSQQGLISILFNCAVTLILLIGMSFVALLRHPSKDVVIACCERDLL